MSVSNENHVREWEPLDPVIYSQYKSACKRTCAYERFHSHALATIFVSIAQQRLYLLKQQKYVWSCVVSTGAEGVGQAMGTGHTPLGLHRIHSKIGDGAAPYAIFKSRVNTGRVASPEQKSSDIIARILRLEGLEEGFNQGKNEEGVSVDSFERYIYIHGTPDEEGLGTPVSEGCIRLAPDTMIELFNRVTENTLVYIYEK